MVCDFQLEDSLRVFFRCSYSCNIRRKTTFYDASFEFNNNKIDVGLCIRDENGGFVFAKIKWMLSKCVAHINEALELLINTSIHK